MNDRFKFRVWDKLDEQYYDENCFQMQIESSGDLFIIGVGNDGEDCFWETDNTVVEQCTGLKDKNGKFIYEGDILKSIYSEIMQYRIYWEGRGYRMRVYGSDNKIVDDCPIFTNAADVLEVIGNIHENGELLDE